MVPFVVLFVSVLTRHTCSVLDQLAMSSATSDESEDLINAIDSKFSLVSPVFSFISPNATPSQHAGPALAMLSMDSEEGKYAPQAGVQLRLRGTTWSPPFPITGSSSIDTGEDFVFREMKIEGMKIIKEDMILLLRGIP